MECCAPRRCQRTLVRERRSKDRNRCVDRCATGGWASPESDGPSYYKSRGTCNDERGRRLGGISGRFRDSGYDGEQASIDRALNVAGPEPVEYDSGRSDGRNLEFDGSHMNGFKIGIVTVN
jgi:hypothetical protein